MLKNIDPLLSPDLLMVLRSMGHGDDIAIVDANFPAAAMARRLVRLDGLTATDVTNAILSVMPLDDFVLEAAWRMEVVGDTQAEQPIFDEFRAIIARHEGSNFRLASLERFAFYEQAKSAYAIVSTGERRLYGNIILKKGVVRDR
ncbi:RbsD/FucU family protein [Microvirga terrestris]|uniref:Ribose ABC transporter n=1 Tax=Microvirga terrestris TaxID=2791024 RepID=A0ABS0HWH5_9HYPH|nr:RbsD/FucU domain-containing protein [Microvirga terrestris]MBF9197838.1 ribose ABC transporter [Microvirga terrestris]